MRHAWDSYWALTGGNILAIPLEFIVTLAAGALLARPLRKLWRRAVGDKADIEDLRRAAAAAERRAAGMERMVADLFEHHTGRRHADAPGDAPGAADSTLSGESEAR